MTHRPLVLLAVALVGLGGCSRTPLVQDAPTRGPVAGYPNHTLAQIRAAVAASGAAVTSASADGRIALTMNGQDQDATYSVRARLRDSVTVVVRGPLGIEGGRGVVTVDSFLVADRINRRLYLGTVDAVERYVPGAGSPEQAARALLGLLVPDEGVAWTVTPDSGAYHLAGRLPDGSSREMTVDPAYWRVVRVRDTAADGRLLGLQETSAFDTIDGVVLPRRVHVAAEGLDAVLEHRQLSVNPDDLRLRFRRPSDYELVPVR